MHKNNLNYLWVFLLLGSIVLTTGCSIHHGGSNLCDQALEETIESSLLALYDDEIDIAEENARFIIKTVEDWDNDREEFRQYVDGTAELLNMTSELGYARLVMCDIIDDYDEEERERFIQSFVPIRTLQENISYVRNKLDTGKKLI